MKMQDVKMMDQVAGREIAELRPTAVHRIRTRHTAVTCFRLNKDREELLSHYKQLAERLKLLLKGNVSFIS